MSLLPENLGDFGDREFWDGFFKARNSVSFEWYGDWPILKPYIHEYCKNRYILVPGCGNSEISSHIYDECSDKIYNIDFSQIVIREMLMKNVRERPKMKWMVMDMTKTKFKNEEFDVILDKGSLDAIAGDTTEESLNSARKYLNEMFRILSCNNGIYLCVSLLQKHVLELICKFFKQKWIVNVEMIDVTGDMIHSDLRPFLIIAQKLYTYDMNVYPNIRCNVDELTKSKQCQMQIKSIIKLLNNENEERRNAINKYNLSELFDEYHNGRRYEFKPENIKKSYNISKFIIIDRIKETNTLQCAAFIVPFKSNNQWPYNSKNGQREIAEKVKSNRVIFIYFLEDIKSMNKTQKELSEVLQAYIPVCVRDKEKGTPFVTVGKEIEKQEVIRFEYESEINGKIIILDVEESQGEWHRLMLFSENDRLIQTESLLKSNNNEEIDDKHILSSYVHVIISSLCLINNLDSNHEVLIVGLGGGTLSNYLMKYSIFKELKIIELDKIVKEAAIKWFNVINSDNIIISDGIQYINNMGNDDNKDVIIIDAAGSDESIGKGEIQCPPNMFLKEEFIKNTAKILKKNKGIFIMNFLCKSRTVRINSIMILKKYFKYIYEIRVKDEHHNIIISKFDEKGDMTQLVRNSKLIFDVDFTWDHYAYLNEIQNI